MHGRYLVLAVLLYCGTLFLSADAQSAEPQKLADGIIVKTGDGLLKVQVVADDIIRVAYSKERSFFERESLSVLRANTPLPQWTLDTTAEESTLSTAKLKVKINLATGAIAFCDSAGKAILAEKAGRGLEAAIVQGARTHHIRQQWEANADESLHGLGQHQLGLMNIKGYDIELWQHNTTASIPFLLSSRGYGVLWDNPSYTRFGDLRQFELIPAERLRDSEGKSGGLTATYFSDARFQKQVAQRVEAHIDIPPPPAEQGPNRASNTRIHPDLPARGDFSIRWEGAIEPGESGEHLLQTFYNGGLRVWLDEKLIMDHWRQDWLPEREDARVKLEAGKRYRLRVEWSKEQNANQIRLTWKTPAKENGTSLWSEVAEGLDYYFIYGPRLDDVVAGYRRLTGSAPMMPIWAFGLWQSRQRYETAKESLDVVDGFRSRKIPFDNIVQDWFYWKRAEWGSHQFDPERFPDPAGWIRQIHERHARVMISVWPKFYPGTDNFEAMRARGFLYERNLADDARDWVRFSFTDYDAFNAEARKLFWSQVDRNLFSKGIDAWWLDATEPDMTRALSVQTQRAVMHPNAMGTGARVVNAYPLVHAGGVYDGQRKSAPDQRVFILTRCAFAGMQRYAAATWSGDISSTWTALAKQIPAGLGFSLSGLPYWTMDIGGFSVPPRFNADNPGKEDTEEWRELNARWFEFGSFVPLLRVHGEEPWREMWQFGGEEHPAYKAQLKFDRLRYRLLPYIYSLAGQATHESGTIMRPLVMDFPGDARAREIGDQYLFGPALLVSPVTRYKARSREVYLPKAEAWYDFWSGTAASGGQTIDAPAPYDAIPLYVRAGSIIPMGPEIQYTTEKRADPVTIYVYGGADGAFTLYEDDGVSYEYEKSAFSRIPMRWNDAARTLTIDKRQGEFAGMLKERTFEIVLITKDKPVAFSFTPRADKTVSYRGDAVELRF